MRAESVSSQYKTHKSECVYTAIVPVDFMKAKMYMDVYYVLVCNFLSDQEFMYMELSMSENVCIHAPFLEIFAFIMFPYWNMRCPLCAPNMV